MNMRWMNPMLIGMLTVCLLGSGAMAADRPDEDGRLLITGSSTMAPLITHMADRYRKSHSGVQITIHGVSSAKGITDTWGGFNSIGMVSRELRGSEKALQAFPIAVDGVCFITAHENGLKNLTLKQLADIFTGRITNWKEVGGGDAPISVVLRDAGASSTKMVSEYLSVGIPDLHGIVIPAENSVTMRTVGRNRHAISYVSFAELNRQDDSRNSVRVLPVDGVLPSMATIGTGTYPLIRVLNLVTKGAGSRLAREFIRYCSSRKVADIVALDGFMPLETVKHGHPKGKLSDAGTDRR